MRKNQVELPAYPGPTFEQVENFTKAQVLEEYRRLRIEPHTPIVPFFDDPDDPGISCTEPPPHWTKARIDAVVEQAEKTNQHCLCIHLHVAYITEWVATLPLKVRWTIIEQFERRAYKSSNDAWWAYSTQRHTPEPTVNRRAAHAVWCTLKEETHDETEQTRPTRNRRSKKAKAEMSV